VSGFPARSSGGKLRDLRQPETGTAMPRRIRSAALTVLLLAAGLLGWTGPASAAAPATLDPTLTAQIDAFARGSLTGGITGAIVSVSDPALGTYLRAYGTSDAVGTPMRSDVHYRIASVSKTFTADAVLRLVDQHRLGLDDPVGRYVAGIPYGEQITIRDLLGMRGGMYDYTNDPTFLARYTADPTYPGWKPSAALQIVRAHASEAKPPNQQTVYSNSEYVLLGLVIERVTGMSAQRYITAVIRNLNLSHTSYPTTDRLPRPFSHGFLYRAASAPAGAAPRDMTLSNPQVPDTAGAMISTVPDMTRYARELGRGVGLHPATARARQQWTPLTSTGVRLQYGLGIIQLGDWVGHDGAIFGYSDMVFYLPARDATVVVMVNAADLSTVTSQALWGQIVKLLYPQSLPTW
jgi:D-alanyl-D-alanine carboxypeptidase